MRAYVSLLRLSRRLGLPTFPMAFSVFEVSVKQEEGTMNHRSAFRHSGTRYFALVGLMFASSAFAVPIVDESGRLLGARNVIVQGFAYDVEFVKGTCADIFTGCDHPMDFAFSDLTAVRAAGQALLDQVFLDADGYLFDSHPVTMAGCDWSGSTRPPTNTACFVWTPFSRLGPSAEGEPERVLRYDVVQNTGSEYIDQDAVIGAGGGGLPVTPSTTTNPAAVWARWTQSSPTSVPEPSTVALFACALMAVVLVRRRRRESPG